MRHCLENHVKRGAFMGKAEERGANAVQMATGVALGGLLALGVELIVLLLGSVAVSNGILKAARTASFSSCPPACPPARRRTSSPPAR